jgi:hypothetical protein
VSSITDRGQGTYTVDFTTAMPDANYATIASVRKKDEFEDVNMLVHLGSTATAYSTTAVAVTTGFVTSRTPQDAELVSVAIHR